MRLTAGGQAGALVVDATDLEFCDGAGASLLLALRQQQESGGGSFTLRGLRDETRQLLDLIAPTEAEVEESPARRESFVTGLGRDAG